MDITLSYLEEEIKTKKVYIYGAWERGYSLCQYLENHGIFVEGYIDMKSERVFHQKKVISWMEFLKNHRESFVLVSLVYHESVMRNLELENIDYLYLGAPVNISSFINYHDVYGNKIRGIPQKCNIELSFQSSVEVNGKISSPKKNPISVYFFSKVTLDCGMVFTGTDNHILADNHADIYIGENVKIAKDVDIFCKNNSSIHIGKNVSIGKNIQIICESNSSLYIGNDVMFGKDTFIKVGEDSNVKIGNSCIFDKNFHMECQKSSSITLGDSLVFCSENKITSWSSGTIILGDYTTVSNNTNLKSNDHTSLILGKDCMLSYNIKIRSANGHSMLDLKNKIKHQTKKDVILSDHVWIGLDSVIMPGTQIGKGSIVGARSFVNKEFGENSLIIGSPADVYRTDITWDRKLGISYDDWVKTYLRNCR